jgi:hypothetical protein
MKRPASRISNPFVRFICLILCCALFAPCFPLYEIAANSFANRSTLPVFDDPPGENLPDLDAEQDEGDKEPQAPDPVPSLLPNCSPDDPECGDT